MKEIPARLSLGYQGKRFIIMTTMKKNEKPGSRPAKDSKLTKKQQLCIRCRKCSQKVGVCTDPTIYEMTEVDLMHFNNVRGATVKKSDDQLFIMFDTAGPLLAQKRLPHL
jgi:DNA-directed RNA polymerase alpha subunit